MLRVGPVSAGRIVRYRNKYTTIPDNPFEVFVADSNLRVIVQAKHDF